MKYMFASDVHGSAYYCRKMLDVYKEEKAERLVLLGDLLYHGPRNDLPREYAPKQVISMLNDMKKEIYAVRGNNTFTFAAGARMAILAFYDSEKYNGSDEPCGHTIGPS